MATFDVLLQHIEHQPEKAVTIYEGKETSYRQLVEKARRLGSYFRSKGLKQGDVVAVLLGNSDLFITCYFACQAAGVSVLPINTRLAPREIEYILNHSEAKLLIYGQEFSRTIEEIAPLTPLIKHFIHVGGDEAHRGMSIQQAIAEASEMSDEPCRGEDTAVIFYTSGTTGKPKGVLLSHNNCEAIAKMWAKAMELESTERVLIVAPLFHCAAAHVFMLPTIQAGGTLVIEHGFSPRQTMEAIERYDITIFFGVPAMYTLLLNQPDLHTLQAPHLRMLTYGAAPMPYELIKKVKQIFPQAKVQNLYGQTENAPGATTLKDPHALDKVGSVGQPLPGCEICIVDDEGFELPVGEVGEIAVKGPHVMKGYLRNPEATAFAMRNGWLMSGDLGRIDEDGFLYIVDRKKDMIIRGGENIYPIEVEEVLFEIPTVLEAAVIGIPHEVYGEVPKACVVVKEGNTITEEEVIHFCEKRLAKYKVPVQVEFLNALPRNASGKVLKTILREEQGR
ncbi:class I adenylate-forming enzyme family protein [Aneurinibacillus sp. REN35]|uniref:class I adenylate-forming enzyme family protein n=1 Tax=Aneurinibacillus sp. REN35 TaxID=3237286 RepID=UPI003527F8D9